MTRDPIKNPQLGDKWLSAFGTAAEVDYLISPEDCADPENGTIRLFAEEGGRWFTEASFAEWAKRATYLGGAE